MDEQQAYTYTDRQVLAREVFQRTLPHIASIEIERRGDGLYRVGLTHRDSVEFPTYTNMGWCDRDFVEEMMGAFMDRVESEGITDG